jgi:hypothetical protein
VRRPTPERCAMCILAHLPIDLRTGRQTINTAAMTCRSGGHIGAGRHGEVGRRRRVAAPPPPFAAAATGDVLGRVGGAHTSRVYPGRVGGGPCRLGLECLSHPARCEVEDRSAPLQYPAGAERWQPVQREARPEVGELVPRVAAVHRGCARPGCARADEAGRHRCQVSAPAAAAAWMWATIWPRGPRRPT